jgi:hypothetical protein
MPLDDVIWRMNGNDPVLEMFAKTLHECLSEGNKEYRAWEELDEEKRRWLRKIVNRFMGIIGTYRMQKAWMILYNNQPTSKHEIEREIEPEKFSGDVQENLTKLRRKRHR